MMGQVSPIPQVQKFHKRGSTGEADAAPFISMLYGSLQWSFYGCFAFVVTGKSGFLVLVYSNIFGCVLGFYYVHGFLSNCKSERSLQRLSFYYRTVSVLVLIQILAFMTLEMHNALFAVGLASSICGMISACSLLTTIPQIIETQCSASVNLPLLVTGMISNSLWSMCGIVLHDVWILVPSFVGLVLQSFAMAAVLYFPRQMNSKVQTHGAQGLLPSCKGQVSAQEKADYLDDEEAALAPGPDSVRKSTVGCKDGGHKISSGYGTMKEHKQDDYQEFHLQQQQSGGGTGGT